MRSFRTGKQAIQLFCSAASFSLRGGRVPSKVLFTAKHLTVFGLFRIALSKRRGEKKSVQILQISSIAFKRVFSFKIVRRYSRERASQSLPNIRQMLEEKLEKRRTTRYCSLSGYACPWGSTPSANTMQRGLAS